MSFFKLNMTSDIKSSGGEIKITEPFIRGTVTQKNVRDTTGRNFVRYIIMETRITTTIKGMKTLIILRRAI